MSTELTNDDLSRLKNFLAPTKIAVVATIGKDGMPQLTPNWYVYAAGFFFISTTKQRVKYLNLARDSRMSVCVMTEPLAVEYATIQGSVNIMEGDTIWPIVEGIVRRYVPEDKVNDRMAALLKEDRVLISMTPERVHFG